MKFLLVNLFMLVSVLTPSLMAHADTDPLDQFNVSVIDLVNNYGVSAQIIMEHDIPLEPSSDSIYWNIDDNRGRCFLYLNNNVPTIGAVLGSTDPNGKPRFIGGLTFADEFGDISIWPSDSAVKKISCEAPHDFTFLPSRLKEALAVIGLKLILTGTPVRPRL